MASDGLIAHCDGASAVLTKVRPEDALGRQLEILPASAQNSRSGSRAGSPRSRATRRRVRERGDGKHRTRSSIRLINTHGCENGTRPDAPRPSLARTTVCTLRRVFSRRRRERLLRFLGEDALVVFSRARRHRRCLQRWWQRHSRRFLQQVQSSASAEQIQSRSTVGTRTLFAFFQGR